MWRIIQQPNVDDLMICCRFKDLASVNMDNSLLLSLFLNLSEKHYATDKNKMMTEDRRVYTRSRWEWETNRRTLDMVFEKWTTFH
jgi:hypothetical protein